MNGADILVEMLIGYEVDTVFGVPGDTNVSFYEALRHREDEITHVMALGGLYGRCLWAIYQSSGNRRMPFSGRPDVYFAAGDPSFQRAPNWSLPEHAGLGPVFVDEDWSGSALP